MSLNFPNETNRKTRMGKLTKLGDKVFWKTTKYEQMGTNH